MQTSDIASPQGTAPEFQRDAKPQRVYAGTGIVWALVAALVAGALLVILIAQNTANVTVHFLWFAPEVSLVVLVLAVAVLAVSITTLVGLVWRHRRRQRLTNRDELRRLHDSETVIH